MIKKLGYEVEVAEEGGLAIEKYRKALNSDNPFDAVILDLTVPTGLGGVDTIKELLKIDPDIKALVSSGYYKEPVMTDYMKHGFFKINKVLL